MLRMPDANTSWTILATVLVALIGGGFAWWRGWLESPKRREDREIARQAAERNGAMADALLGESEVRDLGGGIIKHKVPGMVERVSTLEDMVGRLINQDERLTRVEGRVDRLEIAEEARREVRRESTAMWEAVANKDVIDVDPEDT